MRHIAPYYYAMLKRDVPRHDSGYLFDRDQDGRYLVHALHVDDEIIEAEYFKARFFLKAPFSLDQKESILMEISPMVSVQKISE